MAHTLVFTISGLDCTYHSEATTLTLIIYIVNFTFDKLSDLVGKTVNIMLDVTKDSRFMEILLFVLNKSLFVIITSTSGITKWLTSIEKSLRITNEIAESMFENDGFGKVFLENFEKLSLLTPTIWHFKMPEYQKVSISPQA